MPIKKLLFVLYLLFLTVVTALSHGYSSANEPTQKIYQEEKYGFQFAYPLDWTIQPTIDNPNNRNPMVINYRVTIAKDDVEIHLDLWHNSEKLTLEEWYSKYEQEFHESDSEVVSSPNVMIDGYEAIFVYDKGDDQSAGRMTIAIDRGDEILRVDYYTLDAGKAQDSFITLLDTLSFGHTGKTILPTLLPIPATKLRGMPQIVQQCCAYTDPNSNTYPCDGGNCTWWAKYKRPDIGNYWNNAHFWRDRARQEGFTVGYIPVVGSVVVFQRGVQGASSSAGHVGYVIEVYSNSSFRTSNMGWQRGCDQGNGGVYEYNATATGSEDVTFIYPSGSGGSCCGCALARSANKETWQEIFLESLIGPSATPSAVSSPITANSTPAPQAIAIPQPPTLKASAEKALSVQSLEQLPELSWQAGSDSDGKIVGYAVYWGNDRLGTSEEKSEGLSYRPNILTEGPNYLRVSAIDDQGNQSEWQTVATVIQDTTAPSAELEIASGGDTISTLTTQLQWKGENSAEVRYSSDGKNWSAWESYAPTRLWQLEESDAAQTVYAQLRDSAGNVSKTMQASVKVALPQDLPSSSTYRLVSRVMAAGGGVHSGGSFTVKGTAGQDHQTGTLSGGSYQVQSGFWHAPASSNTAPTSVQLTNSAVSTSTKIGQMLLILVGTIIAIWCSRHVMALVRRKQ